MVRQPVEAPPQFAPLLDQPDRFFVFQLLHFSLRLRFDGELLVVILIEGFQSVGVVLQHLEDASGFGSRQVLGGSRSCGDIEVRTSSCIFS